MKIRELHSWRLSPREAIIVQKNLAGRLRQVPLEKPPKTVAGADVSYSRDMGKLFAAVLVFAFPDLTLAEEAFAQGAVDFPYVPGLLTFREAPILLAAFSKIKYGPDVILFDGQGQAHPRGMGLASHMGLVLDCPAVGCAKTRLVGTYATLGEGKGSWVPLRLDGETIGAVVRTRTGVKPVFVSVGHRTTLPDCVDLVLRCSRKYRIPDPIRKAHIAVNLLRKSR